MNAFAKGLLGLASLGAAVGTVYLVAATSKRSSSPVLELDQVENEQLGRDDCVLLCRRCAESLGILPRQP